MTLQTVSVVVKQSTREICALLRSRRLRESVRRWIARQRHSFWTGGNERSAGSTKSVRTGEAGIEGELPLADPALLNFEVPITVG